ncbi:MAG: endonuclease [Candidatus Diapherotrites archaeon]|nr:endonuclease [Candidatus Diapherotrites archaeon]
MDFFLLFLLVLLVILIGVTIFLFHKISSLSVKLTELKTQKISQSVKYGQLTEQWIPFTKDFPFNPQDFCFIGKPIDGIVFDENKIVFCEFKTNKSQLSAKQKNIKQLVKDKKINWMEYRIE